MARPGVYRTSWGGLRARCPECAESDTLLPGTVPCPECGGLDERCPRCGGEGCVPCPKCGGRTWLPFGPNLGGPGMEGRD